MARVEIETPEQFPFSTEIEILYCHINAGSHVGNDSLVGLLNEARTRYFNSLETNPAGNREQGLINADLAVIYKSESRYGETLVFDLAAQNFQKYGCDLVYRVTEKKTGRLVALAKTAMLMFDYKTSQLTPVPENFERSFY